MQHLMITVEITYTDYITIVKYCVFVCKFTKLTLFVKNISCLESVLLTDIDIKLRSTKFTDNEIFT